MHEADGATFQLAGVLAGVPVLHDMNGRKSITNAAESIVRAVYDLLQPRGPIRAIIYRDSAGMFDAIAVRDGHFAGFIILNAATPDGAFARLAAHMRNQRSFTPGGTLYA